MDIKQINEAIVFGAWTDTELSSMVDAIKFARAGLQRQNIRTLRLGSSVRWTSPKHPRGEEGTVEKIAHKYVTVKTSSGTRWKVPANMLQMVSR